MKYVKVYIKMFLSVCCMIINVSLCILIVQAIVDASSIVDVFMRFIEVAKDNTKLITATLILGGLLSAIIAAMLTMVAYLGDDYNSKSEDSHVA